jgi:hypothetical protein
LRVFSGYSGWAPGQLQNELARGGWHVVPADAESVFDKDPAALWPELIERATTKHTDYREGGSAGGREGESAHFHFPIYQAHDLPAFQAERFPISRSPDLPLSRSFSRSGTERH